MIFSPTLGSKTLHSSESVMYPLNFSRKPTTIPPIPLTHFTPNRAFCRYPHWSADMGLKIISGTRNFYAQKGIWERKWTGKTRLSDGTFASDLKDPKKRALKILLYSSMPSTSRHHWGTDIDIIDGNKTVSGDVLLEKNFHGDGPYVKLRKWMDINAKRFGFYRPYNNNPKRKGFKYEPWHYSYAPIAIPMLKAYVKLKFKDQYCHSIACKSSISCIFM